MNAKLAYLLLGILVKQTVDEFKTIAKQNMDELEKRKERVATYTPNPANPAGSAGAYRVIAENQYAEMVKPHLAKLTRIQRLWKYAPFVLYLLLTIGLFCYVLVWPER